METQIKVLALDAMGVAYKAKDDVAGMSLLARVKVILRDGNRCLTVCYFRLNGA